MSLEPKPGTIWLDPNGGAHTVVEPIDIVADHASGPGVMSEDEHGERKAWSLRAWLEAMNPRPDEVTDWHKAETAPERVWLEVTGRSMSEHPWILTYAMRRGDKWFLQQQVTIEGWDAPTHWRHPLPVPSFVMPDAPPRRVR